MNSFFTRSLKTALVALAAVATIAFTGAASAQVAATSGSCVQNCTPTPMPPAMPSMGLTIQGWAVTGVAALGETNGFGKEVTGEVVTATNENVQIGADSFLTGNAQAGCTINCSDSQSRLSIVGTSGAAVQTVGYARNDGTATGCGTTACPPTAASISQSATRLNLIGSVGQGWTYTPAPAGQ